MVMIVMVLVKLGFFIAAAVWMSLERNFFNYLAQMIVVWVYCLIAAVLMFLDLNLVILHIYLNANGLTTFQFLMIRKEEEKERKRQEIINAHRRTSIKE